MPAQEKTTARALFLLVCLSILPGSLARAALDQQQVFAVARQQGLSTDRIGVFVAALSDCKPILAVNESTPMVVASNMKLITSAAALCMIGADYEFRTELYMLGDLDSHGTLDGDLLVRAGADPNISGRFTGRPTAIFEKWARALREMGVSSISGDVIGDDLIFDREFIHPGWPSDQLTFWYAAPVSSLSFNDNCIDLTVIPAFQAGAPPLIRLSPSTSYIRLENGCVTQEKATKPLVLYRTPGTNNITVRGHVTQGASPWRGSVTVHNPSLYFVHVLVETLQRCGVTVRGEPRLLRKDESPAVDAAAPALLHKSSLVSTINVMNKRSQNLYAEDIFKLLGHEIVGDGSFRGGRKAVESFLRDINAYAPGCNISDGSGLSSAGKLAASQLVAVLCHMYRSPHRLAYVDSLPASGNDGTLKNRLSGPHMEGKVLAKTGYISGASALSGYLFPEKSQPVAFSIIVNGIGPADNSKAKAFQDKLCRILAELVE